MKKKKEKITKWQGCMSHKGCDCITVIPPTGLTCGRESNCQKHNNITDKFIRLKLTQLKG